MAEARAEHRFVPLKLIETWKQDNKCFFCRKKSFQEKLKCEKCLEFEYCSIECLEIDRAGHEEQCDVISVRKGLRHRVPKSFIRFITSRGKLLDDTDDVKDENEARRELEAIKRLKSTEVDKMSDPVRRKKRKKKQAKDADDKYFPIRQQRVTVPVHNIVSGKFGMPVRCSRRELSGQEFGQDWWKTGIETAPPLRKSAPSSKVVLDTIKVTDQDYARMSSAELYPDTDEDTVGEVNGNQQTHSNKTRRIPNKSKGKGSRKTKKPEVQDRGEEARAMKPKPPKSNAVKTEMGSTKSEEEVGKRVGKQTDGDLGVSTCCFCSKKGNGLKSCMGCKKIKYCDKNCQSRDYKNHSNQCKRDQRFQQVVKKIPTTTMAAMCTGVSLNPLALTFEQKEVGRAHQSLLLEIVQARFLMFAFGAMTVDSIGRNIFTAVILPLDILFESVNEKTGVVTMVTLETCLRPGNFILVFNPNCVAFINGTPTLEIIKPESVCFLLTNHPSTS